MNTPVSKPIAKLLKEKGFRESTEANWYILAKDHSKNYNKGLPADESKVFFTKDSYELSNIIEIDEDTIHQVFHVLAVPSIVDVVMWFYEKHGIWIEVQHCGTFNQFSFKVSKLNNDNVKTEPHYVCEFGKGFNSPTKACEAAIEYTLNNLI